MLLKRLEAFDPGAIVQVGAPGAVVPACYSMA